MRLLRPNETSKMLGVTTTTLRDMDKRGVLHPIRTSGNQRRFREDEVKELMGLREIRVVAIYGRVSSQDQKKDLKLQIQRLKHKYPEAEVYKDIRSGLKFNRNGFKSLLSNIQKRRISKVIITHKDRLTRFGFDLLELVFMDYGTEIEAIDESQESSPEEELVKDLISIITSFSARLYGLRSHKSKKLVDMVKKEISK